MPAVETNRRALGQRLLAGASALFALWAIVPIAIHVFFCPVTFNQFLIHELEIRHKAIAPSDVMRMAQTAHASGLNILQGNGIRELPSFEDPTSVRDYVFSWIPLRATVYPTEGFYYFVTEIAEGPVSGNFRLADLDKNHISFAYFPVGELEGKTIVGAIDPEDGLVVDKKNDFAYDVTLGKKTVRFEHTRTAIEPPKKTVVLDGEEFVGQVQDESGEKLFLLYNRNTTSFYYVLNEERTSTDPLVETANNIWVGQRTRFAYYHDDEFDRKLLLGVHLAHIAENDFFDGPGDQVPFRANLRERLYDAYPNTRLGEGVDTHGIIQGKDEWVRVAITPFNRYSKLGELDSHVARVLDRYPPEADRSVFWSALTKEFWNRPAYRHFVCRRLESEGKSVADVIIHQLPATEEEQAAQAAEASIWSANQVALTETARMERVDEARRRPGVTEEHVRDLVALRERAEEMQKDGILPVADSEN